MSASDLTSWTVKLLLKRDMVPEVTDGCVGKVRLSSVDIDYSYKRYIKRRETDFGADGSGRDPSSASDDGFPCMIGVV